MPCKDRLIIAAMLCAMAVLSIHAVAHASTRSKQLIAIGIDGATWSIIDALRSQGKLPTLDRLIESGSRGELEVPLPSISPSLWTTIASGVPADVHGIEDFWNTSSDVATKRVWEIADEHGLTTGALGYLLTWPPAKESGFLVPGWLAQDNQTIPKDISFLKDLEALEHSTTGASLLEIARLTLAARSHGASFTTLTSLANALLRQSFGDDAPGAIDLMRREVLTELSADVFCDLLEEHQPELGIYYQHHVDAIEHFYFANFQPDAFGGAPRDDTPEKRQAIPRIYASTDRAIARIEACAHEEATILILSDHGQRPGKLSRFGMPVIKSTTLLEQLGLGEVLHATNVGDLVFLRPRNAEESLAEARKRLLGIEWAEGGGSVFNVMVHETGNLLVRFKPRRKSSTLIRIDESVYPISEVMDSTRRLSGTHTERAIVLMTGPGIQRAHLLPLGDLLDVAPTVLTLLGLPIGRDMPGRVMFDAFRPEARERWQPTYIDTHGPAVRIDVGTELNEETRERLRSLGYVQ